jgi:hypothetical protein
MFPKAVSNFLTKTLSTQRNSSAPLCDVPSKCFEPVFWNMKIEYL